MKKTEHTNVLLGFIKTNWIEFQTQSFGLDSDDKFTNNKVR